MSGRIRLGLVGLGTIARQQHIPAIAETPAFELSAAASRNAELAGLPSYRTVQEMLGAEAELSAVSLCTPPQGRFEQAASVLASGKHLMLEKPPGSGVSEVRMLAAMAQAQGVSLYATWHARMGAAVQDARSWLSAAELRSVEIAWKENVRSFHPGQSWIWEAGGFGVFDAGINALSVLTAIIPDDVRVVSSLLEIPGNCQMPIAARLSLESAGGVPVAAAFDWLHEGEPTWDICVETDRGSLLLRNGGALLMVDGQVLARGEDLEYLRLYQRFAELILEGESEVDLRPMEIVADAFVCGERVQVPDFVE